MSTLKVIGLALPFFALQAAAAFAEDLPKLDVSSTCNGAAQFGREKKACLEEEATAKRILGQTWSKFNADDKVQCVGSVQAGGPASYVELQSCLEAMRDAKEVHEDAAITDQPGRRRK